MNDRASAGQSCGDVTTHRSKESDEYFFREGCYILEVWNDPRDPELSIARARVLPGQSTRLHSLSETVERYLVVQGQGIFKSGDFRADLTPGQTVLIPAGAPQSVVNTGDTDLVFLAICTPRFRPENFKDLDSEPG